LKKLDAVAKKFDALDFSAIFIPLCEDVTTSVGVPTALNTMDNTWSVRWQIYCTTEGVLQQSFKMFPCRS
jgi:hypothetical protein